MELRDTIKEIIKNHCENGGMILGQCLSAVGWVNNTIDPETKNLIELPMTDVAATDIAAGAAVAGRRPILVIRFQDFLLLNGNALIVFAAKRKEIFGKSCPVFVRAIGREGKGTGNSHSGKLHSTFMHFPGLRIWAPITPMEYKACWNDFMLNDEPLICFEHQATFDNDEEFYSTFQKDADITIFAISFARINALKAIDILKKEGIVCNIIYLIQLRPYSVCDTVVELLRKSKRGLVVDTGFETCGAGRDFAYQLTQASGIIVKAIGLEDKSVGVAKGYENLTPSSEKIVETVKKMVCND